MPRPVVATLAVFALALVADPAGAARHVGSAAEFQAAVAAYRGTGGTIVLRPGTYARPLVVGSRPARRLTIRGRPGSRIHSLVLDRTQAVTVRDVIVRPVGRDGGILARRSRGIVLDGLRVTAVKSRHSVSVDLEGSYGVTVENSRFSHCGDRKPGTAPCLFPRYASHVVVRRNRFHECRGCDFVHGRAGRRLVIEDNSFERAPPCDGTVRKCGHQDAIELFRGDGVIIRRNVFGPTGRGGGQINLSRSTHHVRIVNNLFHARGAAAARGAPRRGISVGTRVSRDLPQDVRILNNTILSGNNPGDERASSVVVSPFYEAAPVDVRPVIANNVLARLRTSHVCGRVRRSVRNVAMRGGGCSAGDRLADPRLTADGRPTADSAPLIDRAALSFAPRRDMVRRTRVGPPDIGAYEFVP